MAAAPHLIFCYRTNSSDTHAVYYYRIRIRIAVIELMAVNQISLPYCCLDFKVGLYLKPAFQLIWNLSGAINVVYY